MQFPFEHTIISSQRKNQFGTQSFKSSVHQIPSANSIIEKFNTQSPRLLSTLFKSKMNNGETNHDLPDIQVPDTPDYISEYHPNLCDNSYLNPSNEVFFDSIREYMSSYIRSSHYNGKSREDISSYLSDFRINYSYRFCGRILDTWIAIGRSLGNTLFNQTRNLRFHNSDTSSGTFCSMVEIILNLPSLLLISKSGDNEFKKMLTCCQLPKYRHSHYFLQIINDINSSSDNTQLLIENEYGSYLANITLVATSDFSLSNITSVIDFIALNTARWTNSFSDSSYERDYQTTHILGSFKDYGTEQISEALSNNGPISILNSLLNEGLIINDLISDDPKKFCRAMKRLSRFQKLWHSYCNITNAIEMNPHDFLNYKSSKIQYSPIMTGFYNEPGTVAYTLRHGVANKEDICYSMMFQTTINLELSSQFALDYANNKIKSCSIDFAGKMCGDSTFHNVIIAAYHGNDRPITWNVSYNRIFRNTTFIPDRIPLDEEVVASSLVGIKKTNMSSNGLRHSSLIVMHSYGDINYSIIPARSRCNEIDYDVKLEHYELERKYYFTSDEGDYINERDFMYFQTYDWDINTSPSLVSEMFERFIWSKFENYLYVAKHQTELDFQKQFRLKLIKQGIKSDAFENLSLIALTDSVNTNQPIMFHCRYYTITNIFNGATIKTRDPHNDFRLKTFMTRNVDEILNEDKSRIGELTVAFMISVEVLATVTGKYRVTSQDDSNVISITDRSYNNERTLWTKEVLPIGFILIDWNWIKWTIEFNDETVT
uniref:Uncharacterized protein n=1 Tax=viral metagenome TaxID=1070528 RepID=A0A2V0R9R9_9ZZZZ